MPRDSSGACLPGVLLAAGLVWLMTGLFAPLTLGLLLAALMAPMAEALSRHTGCPRRLAAVGTMALFYLLLGLGLTAAGFWAAGQGAQLLRQLPGCGIPPASGPGAAPAPAGGVLPARYAPVTAPLVDWAAAALERSLPGLLSGLSSRAASLDRPLALQASRSAAGQCIHGDPRLLRSCRLSPALCAPPGQSAARADCPSGGTALFRQPGAAADAPRLGDPLAGIAGSAVRRAVAAGGRASAGSGLCRHPAGPASAHRQRYDPAALGALGALPGPCCPGGGALGCSSALPNCSGPFWNPGCWAPAPDCLRWYSPRRSLPGCGWAGHWGLCCSRQRYCSCGIWAARGSCPGSGRRAQTADFPFSGQQKKRPPHTGQTPLVFLCQNSAAGQDLQPVAVRIIDEVEVLLGVLIADAVHLLMQFPGLFKMFGGKGNVCFVFAEVVRVQPVLMGNQLELYITSVRRSGSPA